MDLAIITTKNLEQKKFWDERLKHTFPKTRFIVVIEEWPGGAGNGLGTLNAFLEADAILRKEGGPSLHQWLETGHPLALYHCAGEGKRLYPLSASEHNNKAAMKLPGLIPFEVTEDPITLLEAILKQTDPLVKMNTGRLSVFWGDQLFFSSQSPHSLQRHPLEIYVKDGPVPSSEAWTKHHLENYGIVCFDPQGNSLILEKCDWDLFEELVKEGYIDVEKGLRMSFGSFSVTLPLLRDLLKEFTPELEQKKEKFDTEPHFWMPLTLPLSVYQKVMENKGMSLKESQKHFERLQSIRSSYQNVFGPMNLGSDCGWWDFGNVAAYKQNLLKILEKTDQSQYMREFLNMPADGVLKSNVDKLKSVRSIVVGTNAKELNVEDSVIIGCLLNKLSCKNSLFYNVRDDSELNDQTDVVRADVKGQRFYSTLHSDPKKNWDKCLQSNPMSWADLHRKLS